MEVLICIPCKQYVDFNFVNSLLNLIRPADSGFCLVESALIYQSRHDLTQVAIDNNAEYILWLDSDMVFPEDLYLKLKENDKDICTGLYITRTSPYEPVLFKDIELSDNLEIINAGSNYSDYPKDSLFEVDAAGMGCMLVKTKVLKDIAGYYRTIFEPQNLIGEDIAFCQRAKKLGYEVWCDSRIKCGHVGVSIITEDTYNVAQEIKAVEEAEKLNENNIASVSEESSENIELIKNEEVNNIEEINKQTENKEKEEINE